MRRKLMLVLATAAAACTVLVGPSAASTPPEHTVTAQPGPSTQTVTWTGTIPPGADPLSDCNGAALTDDHTIHLQIPAGFYSGGGHSQATFKISWSDASQDEILTVNGPDGEVGSSDGSGASEIVPGNDLKAGDYTASACGFTSTAPTQYTGTLTLTTTQGGEPSLPAADAQGLRFSASVPADPQRDEAEPDIRSDGAGHVVTCGPTGFSGASDYAQISNDGGDQFHLIGEEPRGQQGSGGGGDCGLAFGVKPNAAGNFTYAYTGLGPLTGFTTSTSPDDGHTLTTAGPQGNGNTAKGGLADRQWMAFLDANTVLLSYNQQQPRNVVVQKSTNGGLTYNDIDPSNPVDRQGVIASANPDFPGPMRSMPARLAYPNAGPEDSIAYYGWNASDANAAYVNFAISDPSGLVWHNCRVAKLPLDSSGGLGAFTVADNDRDGNIYLTYADKKGFHSYLTTLTHDKLAGCAGANDADTATLSNPGWSAPVQVDRGNVRSTVFPWLAAGGEPGRVAVAFYGTESDGDPNDGAFKASWDVYVNQSLNALSPNPSISQVKATTHPFHYDSICLRGLACDLAQPKGDRSLADFFGITFDKKTGRLMVVYDQGAKKPDEPVGHIATPAVVTQTGGPSNGGGTVAPGRATLRDGNSDPTGDATADYSNTNHGPPSPTNVPAMDFKSDAISDQTNLSTGAKVAGGGFNVTLKLADLSNAALQSAAQATKSGSLLWIFRFVNGYQASAAVARWSPTGGFSFGYNDYTTASGQCGSSDEKCQVYPGDKAMQGKVDQKTGTITMSVPRSYLHGLSGPTGNGQRPALSKAGLGTRFYDGTAFSLGNVAPDPTVQTFLYPIDNTPAMDFVLGGLKALAGSGGGSGANACAATAGFRKVSVTPRKKGLRFAFVRRQNHAVKIDVFRESVGRRVLNQRRVARFKNRRTAFNWNGRTHGHAVGAGYYFVRLAIPTSRGHSETRRVTLRESGGRWHKRPAFALRDRCTTLESYKLTRPVFGGSNAKSLSASYRLAHRARVSMKVLRGKKTIRTVKARTRRANKTFRLALKPRGLRKGDYKVKITVKRGKATTRGTITGRRL